jgi:hypothetical protein
MIPKNIVPFQEFERQNRNRLQQEAENSRLLKSVPKKSASRVKFPAWEFNLSKFRFFGLREKHAS